MIIVDANGANIPALGFGTWNLRDEAATSLVAKALQIGYRHIDTAVMYANQSEVGAGLKASGVPRKEIFLTTKIWPDDYAAADFERKTHECLELLDVDYVDLLLMHWPSRDVPLAETLGALNRVHEAGLARNIGISNFTVAMIDEAVALSAAHLVCNQVEYHPFLNQDKVLAACRRQGMAMTAYCPLARGKIVDDPVIGRIAAAHGKNAGQITLRWLVQQENIVAIPKTATPERAASNFDIFDFELSAQDMADISALGSPQGRIVTAIVHAPNWDE